MRLTFLLWHNPDLDSTVPPTRWIDRPALRWMRLLQLQDLVWVLLFAAIIALNPDDDASEITMLVSLAAVQIAESKFPFLSTIRGKILWNVFKLGIVLLLIGYTGGVNSSYYLLLLLPMVSAAISLGVLATLLFSILSCAGYLSFLLFVDWSQRYMEPEDKFQLALRAIFLVMAGNLANALAGALRVQSEQSKKVAEQLADANQSLREAEDAVRRSDRLAALGQLSAGLAHELRNPLGTIKASAEMLSRSVA